ncbi:MAG: hypothetical protein KBD82_11210 [Rhodoferax sp.]|jgi:hypothetical protein|uniref:hypothetical protein n=1 Tax=Rhodoferax sp. TaxID=50421 RepID=UPI001B470A54|nr:hypothetical protein [Rhodoferax sp.]MBP9736192.1 hypothetical protein [Rhodoferax sp.]
MRCSRCKRPLKFAAVVSGNLTIGPTCAKRMGLRLDRFGRVAAPIVQAGQLALFEVQPA